MSKNKTLTDWNRELYFRKKRMGLSHDEIIDMIPPGYIRSRFISDIEGFEVGEVNKKPSLFLLAFTFITAILTIIFLISLI